MADKTYRLVLENGLSQGAGSAATSAALCSIFKLDAARAELYGRGDIQLASKMDIWQAQEYAESVKKVGAACRIEEEPPPPPAIEQPVPTGMVTECARCGWHRLDGAPVQAGKPCPYCGSVLGAPPVVETPAPSPYNGPYPNAAETAARRRKKLRILLKRFLAAAGLAALALMSVKVRAVWRQKSEAAAKKAAALAALPKFNPQAYARLAAMRKAFNGQAFPFEPEKQYHWYRLVYLDPMQAYNWHADSIIAEQAGILDAGGASAMIQPEELKTLALNAACYRNKLLSDKIITRRTLDTLENMAAGLGFAGLPSPKPGPQDTWRSFLLADFDMHCPVRYARDVSQRPAGIKPSEIRPLSEMEYLLVFSRLETEYRARHGAFTEDLEALVKEFPDRVPDRKLALSLLDSQAIISGASDDNFWLAAEEYPGGAIVLDKNGFAGKFPETYIYGKQVTQTMQQGKPAITFKYRLYISRKNRTASR